MSRYYNMYFFLCERTLIEANETEKCATPNERYHHNYLHQFIKFHCTNCSETVVMYSTTTREKHSELLFHLSTFIICKFVMWGTDQTDMIFNSRRVALASWSIWFCLLGHWNDYWWIPTPKSLYVLIKEGWNGDFLEQKFMQIMYIMMMGWDGRVIFLFCSGWYKGGRENEFYFCLCL